MYSEEEIINNMKKSDMMIFIRCMPLEQYIKQVDIWAKEYGWSPKVVDFAKKNATEKYRKHAAVCI